MFRRLLLATALAWALAALLGEMRAAFEELDQRAVPGTANRRWQFGTPRVERLAAAADEVRRRIPPGSTLAFASPDDGADFDRFRWLAYLLPEDQVMPLADPRSATAAGYLLTVRRPIVHPRLEPLGLLPGGARLYRVRP